MSNFKCLIAAALLCGVAAVSFAQVPSPAKDAGAAVSPADPAVKKKAHAPAKKVAAKKRPAKKVHKAGAAKKSASVVPAA